MSILSLKENDKTKALVTLGKFTPTSSIVWECAGAQIDFEFHAYLLIENILINYILKNRNNKM